MATEAASGGSRKTGGKIMRGRFIRVAGVAVVAAAMLAGTSQAKSDSAASHYTPRALKALGQQWEAKANFYGKHSASKLKSSAKRGSAPAQTPISTSPPEGAGCNAMDEPCAPQNETPTVAPTAPPLSCVWLKPNDC
jgi:hypothetical protein